MRKWTKHKKQVSLFFAMGAVVSVLGIFTIHPVFGSLEHNTENYYTLTLNDVVIGQVSSLDGIQEMLLEEKSKVASEQEGLTIVKADFEYTAENRIFAKTTSERDLKKNIQEVLQKGTVTFNQKAYTVKINQFTVTLSSKEEVVELLNAAKEKYDTNNEYQVELVADSARELNVMTTEMVKMSKSENDNPNVSSAMINAGICTVTDELSYGDTNIEDVYTEGLVELSFADTVEVIESYVKDDEITPLSEAIDLVTKDKEKNKIYEVKSGDSLSVIAESYNTTVDNLVAINENIDNADSVIRIGDELTVTVPEPELSVITKEEKMYNEEYQAETQYIDNDFWYTTEQVVRQEASTGERNVIAMVTNRNGEETEREIIHEEVIKESQPAIIERGTKTPPTYIKPISGGTFTSGFKFRWGRQHKGVDWACPIGTAVKASSAGTVVSAGWVSGYGYCVTISHSDGRQTRYAHLSKILVSVGQSVSQGEKIALSGNTGRSTGPHVHFEIIINGSQVDPMKYLD